MPPPEPPRSKATSIVDVYQRHGAAWVGLRTSEPVEVHWLDSFCDLLPAAGAVLDAGCGSGVPIAAELLRRGFAVTGVDAARTMLDLFRGNLPTAEAYLTDMRRLALSRSVAGLLAWDSFFHLSPDDQRGMFPRFRAHAAPRTALMFTSGDAEGEAIGDLEGAPLYHGSLDAAEYRALLEANGFGIVAHVSRDPTCGNRTIWLAQLGIAP